MAVGVVSSGRTAKAVEQERSYLILVMIAPGHRAAASGRSARFRAMRSFCLSEAWVRSTAPDRQGALRLLPYRPRSEAVRPYLG